ncbi:hypothetical protein SDC9_47667 [bioreactor metagenome]|uniref:Uncharacterized protein n=1 Tax=bioreactor metagenome TaxID=1076179 RepID=A0A644WD14_9ZZZZ
MRNLTMEDARNLYKQTIPKNKIITIADIDIEVTPILSAEEVLDFIYQVMTIVIAQTTDGGQVVNIDWIIRAVTIIKYTNFKLDDVHSERDICGFTELLYGTPLFAMLVGSPERPVYCGNKAYTSPAVDIEQYQAIISTVENTLPKYILWSYFKHKYGDEKNEETKAAN